MSPNPTPYIAEVEDGWSYASIRLIELLDVDRDKFTFPSYVIKPCFRVLDFNLLREAQSFRISSRSVDQHITSFYGAAVLLLRLEEL